ncbi:hypothetical protein pb186bvf_010511 [Paramecium bursaria]
MGKINRITIKLVKEPENQFQIINGGALGELKSQENSQILIAKNIKKNKSPKQSSKIIAPQSLKANKPRKTSKASKQYNAQINIQNILDQFQEDFQQTKNMLNQFKRMNHQKDNKENMKSKETSIEYITIEEEVLEEPSFIPCPVCETFQTITKEQMLNHIRGTHKINGSWLNNMIM